MLPLPTAASRGTIYASNVQFRGVCCCTAYDQLEQDSCSDDCCCSLLFWSDHVQLTMYSTRIRSVRNNRTAKTRVAPQHTTLLGELLPNGPSKYKNIVSYVPTVDGASCTADVNVSDFVLGWLMVTPCTTWHQVAAWCAGQRHALTPNMTNCFSL